MRRARARLTHAQRDFHTVSQSDRRSLHALVANCNTPQKHLWRAEIVLFTADRLGTNEIMGRTAKSRTCVWRSQERFAEGGLDGLLRDKTQPRPHLFTASTRGMAD